ncbi:GatB/YqeY domain-containing protein [Planctomycetota bacterium]|nr:GatB/YqeY domain-containing protein [Planctomycetota bacterium]
MNMIAGIKQRVRKAMLERNDFEKSILKVALGDLETEASRSADEITNERCEQIIRKMVKSANEMIKLSKDEAMIEKCKAEIVILETLLPKTLSVDEIVAALESVKDNVLAAGNDGQAMGVAMKHLKSSGAIVEGKDVNAAIRKIRS